MLLGFPDFFSRFARWERSDKRVGKHTLTAKATNGAVCVGREK
jgi:hypothetical protein